MFGIGGSNVPSVQVLLDKHCPSFSVLSGGAVRSCSECFVWLFELDMTIDISGQIFDVRDGHEDVCVIFDSVFAQFLQVLLCRYHFNLLSDCSHHVYGADPLAMCIDVLVTGVTRALQFCR